MDQITVVLGDNLWYNGSMAFKGIAPVDHSDYLNTEVEVPDAQVKVVMSAWQDICIVHSRHGRVPTNPYEFKNELCRATRMSPEQMDNVLMSHEFNEVAEMQAATIASHVEATSRKTATVVNLYN